jgi:2-haloacid dehalogenase
VAPDPVAFNTQWRSKQLEYTFLRTLMGKYRDFWKVTQEALEFAIQRFTLQITPEQRQRLMEAWLHPTPYPEVVAALPRLQEKYPLAILSNGTPRMLRTGLERTGLRPHFRWVLSAHAVRLYKPTPQVYQLAPQHMRLPKRDILFVSSNAFDVVGAKNFGFRVCWINRTMASLDPLGPTPDLVVMSFNDLAEAL